MAVLRDAHMLKKTIAFVAPLLVVLFGLAPAAYGDSPSSAQEGAMGAGKPPQAIPSQALAQKPRKSMPSCREAGAGGPEEVVRTLYREYASDDHKSVTHEPEAVLSKFFDAKVAALLLENQECWKNTGDICAIDMNILYVAQDYEISDFKVCEMDAVSHAVAVQFRSFGEPHVVTYDMSNAGGGWRISDITSQIEDGEWSLCAVLAGHFDDLAAAWGKAHAPEKPVGSHKNRESLPYCERAKAGGPEDMVSALYEQYPWKGDRVIINEPRGTLLKYFDEDFATAIVREQEYRTKNDYPLKGMPNIIINHDMENSQHITDFHICAMDAHTKTVRVQFRNGGEPRIVAFKFARAAAGWRISDILYKEGTRPVEAGDEDVWYMKRGLSVAP